MQQWDLDSRQNKSKKIKTVSSKKPPPKSGPETLMFVDILCKSAFWQSLLTGRIGQTSFRNLCQTGPKQSRKGNTELIRSRSAEGALQTPVHGLAWWPSPQKDKQHCSWKRIWTRRLCSEWQDFHHNRNTLINPERWNLRDCSWI